jgi:3-oxoacyl-[acyl-carrier protein] reductase
MSAPPPYPPARGLLAGKTVLVTAAAGTGIGFATARRCAEEGARLLISDLHERRLVEAVDKVEAATGARPAHQLCDVTRQEQVDALVRGALHALGRIDVLVNNAGLGGFAHLVDMSDEQWSRVLDVTLTGTFRVTRAVLPHMIERRARRRGRRTTRPPRRG